MTTNHVGIAHWILTCLRHDIAEKLLIWHLATITHSLTHSPHHLEFISLYKHYSMLVRKDVDGNEHERLHSITLRHKLK